MESRKYKLYARNPGGNAGGDSKQYRLSLPTKWIKEMGIDAENRTVVISFDGEKITIKKAEEQ